MLIYLTGITAAIGLIQLGALTVKVFVLKAMLAAISAIVLLVGFALAIVWYRRKEITK